MARTTCRGRMTRTCSRSTSSGQVRRAPFLIAVGPYLAWGPLDFLDGMPGFAAQRRETTMPPRRVAHTVRQAPSSYPHSEEPKRMRKTSSRSVTGACGNPTGAPVQTGASRSSEARGSSIPSRTRSSGASGPGRQAR